MRRRNRAAVLALVALSLLSADLWAADGGQMHVELRTLGMFTRELRPGDFSQTDVRVPTWQILSFHGDDLGGKGVFASGSAFLGQQWGDEGGRAGRAGDIPFGFVGWRSSGGSINLRAGRIYVFGGPNYALLDGGSATFLLPADLRVDLYGGMVARAGLDTAFEAPMCGARLAWMAWELGHLGVAIQHMEEAAGVARESLGADFALRAFAPLLLTGTFAWDMLDGVIQQGRLDAAWTFNRWFDLFLRGEVRDPLAWLSRTSIFNAFLQRTDGLVGGGMSLRTPGALAVSTGYERFLIDDDRMMGYRGYVDLRLRPTAKVKHSAGLLLSRVSHGDDGYSRVRLYGSLRPAPAWTISCAADAYQLFRPIHDEDRSITGTLAVRWLATPGLTVGVDGEVWQNPYFDKQGLLLASLRITDELLRPPPPPGPTKATWGDADEEEKEDEAKEDEAKADEDKDDEAAVEPAAAATPVKAQGGGQ